jgi:hypothetical protein
MAPRFSTFFLRFIVPSFPRSQAGTQRRSGTGKSVTTLDSRLPPRERREKNCG